MFLYLDHNHKTSTICIIQLLYGTNITHI